MDDPSTAGVTEGFGLMFYNARMYDPALGRFTSADSIVPAGVQGYDRYAYVSNNPVKYTDPTGHMQSDDDDGGVFTPTPSSPPDDETDDNDSLSSLYGGGSKPQYSVTSDDEKPYCENFYEVQDCALTSDIELTLDEIVSIQNTIFWLQAGEAFVGFLIGTATLPLGILVWAEAAWEITDLAYISSYFDKVYEAAYAQPDQKITITVSRAKEYGPSADMLSYEGAHQSYGVTAPFARLFTALMIVHANN